MKFQLILSALALCYCVTLSTSFHDHVTSSSQDFISCLESKSNNVNGISKLIFTPNNVSFLPIWEVRVNNNRFNKSSTPKPSVIVTPIDDAQIRATLLCSKKCGYEMRIRSGGHDYEGVSSTTNVPFVMLDLARMRSVNVDVAKRTAWAQGGTTVGEVYYAISQKTNKLYFPGSICPTVGISGYLGGGGYGNMMRKYGIGADNVVDVRFMDVNGKILDRKTMGEDLFWAIRGGGAASFGIVLAWKLRLVPVPELVTVFLVNITLEQGATEIFYKYQHVIPNIDENLSIRVQMSSENIGNTSKKTVRMLFFGLYQGSMDTLLSLLDEKYPELNVTRENCQEVTMVQSTLFYQGFPTDTSLEVLANRTVNFKLDGQNKLDYVRSPIPINALKKIWRQMFKSVGSTLIMQPFGGKMDEYSETTTPFSHRAGVLYQFHQFVQFNDQTSDTTPISLQRISWLRNFNKYITPYVSKNPREAYYNYIDFDLGVNSATYEEASVWGNRYWKKDNFKKLIRIKAKVDPQNFFKHPQSIPLF
ncbi:tetrahydroberberine oxidase-like [Rutidosis leptorrhynchoides]|uniref:tetrahydroberberine oxidase-like n=1 Tax=Rutidosis leptorrhynchoides TaxID=125765 RepID=UPI003A99C744